MERILVPRNVIHGENWKSSRVLRAFPAFQFIKYFTARMSAAIWTPHHHNHWTMFSFFFFGFLFKMASIWVLLDYTDRILAEWKKNRCLLRWENLAPSSITLHLSTFVDAADVKRTERWRRVPAGRFLTVPRQRSRLNYRQCNVTGIRMAPYNEISSR